LFPGTARILLNDWVNIMAKALLAGIHFLVPFFRSSGLPSFLERICGWCSSSTSNY
jgi:hypothetical protein